VGTTTARGGAGVGFSDATAGSSFARGIGVFLGFGVSSSVSADLVVSLALRAVSFSCDLFFADFGLGVGV